MQEDFEKFLSNHQGIWKMASSTLDAVKNVDLVLTLAALDDSF